MSTKLRDKRGKLLHVGDKVVVKRGEDTKVVSVVELGRQLITVQWGKGQAKVPARTVTKLIVTQKEEPAEYAASPGEEVSIGDIVEYLYKERRGQQGIVIGNRKSIVTITKQGGHVISPVVQADEIKKIKAKDADDEIKQLAARYRKKAK